MKKIITTILISLFLSGNSYADQIIRHAILRHVTFNYSYYAPYIGPVATRGRLNDFFGNSTSLNYMQSRTFHVATDNISSAQVVFNGLYISGGNENAAAGVGDITASIEYPAGTFNQLTWSGSPTGHMDGNNLISDKIILSTSIPTGSTFWVRSWVHWTSTNKPFSTDGMQWIYPSTGEAAEWSTTAPTDKTMGGTINITSFHAAIYRPVAILGTTRRATFFLAGDSRTRASGSGGNNDISGGFPGTIGELERSIAAKGFGYINGSMIGDSYAAATQSDAYVKRGELANYCTHIIDNYGINDLGTSATIAPSTFNSYMATLKAVTGLVGKPYYHTTLTPRSTSTDNWSTLMNQTSVASTPSRISLNDALRAGTLSSPTGYVELADANESSRDSGLWRVDQGRILTSDITTTSNNTTIVSIGGNFLSTDAARAITITGLGTLSINTITNSTHAVVQAASATVVSGATAYIGYATIDGLHNQIDADLNILNSNAFNIFNYLK